MKLKHLHSIVKKWIKSHSMASYLQVVVGLVTPIELELALSSVSNAEQSLLNNVPGLRNWSEMCYIFYVY